MKFFVTMFSALIMGVLVFILIHWGVDYAINKEYMSDTSIANREKDYIDNLQSYITRNDLSSKDTADITQWVKSQRYVYLVIYKDKELIYDSQKAAEEEEQKAHGTPLPDAADKDTDSSDKKPSATDTKSDISQYFDTDGTLFPIKLSDGTMFASVSEFTQELYYNLSYIVSIMAAFILFAVIMMIYFNQTTIRIERLAGDVRKIEQNNDLPDIVSSGCDEIAGLANDVNKMKNSIFKKMQEEQDAWRANTELITAMSHDIRNPLTVLMGYLDVMDMQQDTSDTLKSYIAACKETTVKIKNLSDDMFQYFLVFGKKDIDMSIEEYDAQTLLEQTLAEHMLLMTENGYTFVSEMLDKQCTISIDAAAWARVIDNLFSNLKKYADKTKPIYISVTADQNDVTLIMKNSTVQNDVESNGIGLKTCAKIMASMNDGFCTEANNDMFTVTIKIPIKRIGSPWKQ